MADPDIKQAVDLMRAYAQRTGLTSDRPGRRYLWTDAFAVCNFIGLARTTGEQGFLALAARLVDKTHQSLARHRDDDPRRGWISGLQEDEGEAHPTLGGLRIGKPLPERRPDEPFDERLEWERDGQYFHYLSKWMHALDQLGRATRQPRYRLWAQELALAAQQAFVDRTSPDAPPTMYWKMSIDLTRPLVPLMGQHDPLDGYVTFPQLRADRVTAGSDALAAELDRARLDFATMLAGGELASTDALGIGGLLVDAYRIAQLTREGAAFEPELLSRLLDAALEGLKVYAESGELQVPARYRLAFRELGLAIGLHALQRLAQGVAQGCFTVTPASRKRLAELSRYAPLGSRITAFWRTAPQQGSAGWTEHRDINEVMLATGLAPDGFLELVSE